MIDLMWGQKTHSGRRRRNEDAIVATPSLFAVADGMGGHSDGDIASSLAVKALENLGSTRDLARAEVLDAIRQADREITRAASVRSDGMGTTISGLAVMGASSSAARFLVFNVGDSRTYRLRGGRLEQLTRDHSIVQDLFESGEIEREEITVHPQRHVVTRSLGAPERLEIDWWTLEPEENDRYLVASDGLSTELDETRIAQLLSSSHHPQQVAHQLTTAALEAGGRDNISVIVVDVMTVRHEGRGASLDDDTSPLVGASAHSHGLISCGIDDDTSPRPMGGPLSGRTKDSL